MRLIKLTSVCDTTFDDTKWGRGITHKIDGPLRIKNLCRRGILHAYTSLNLALLLNPVHADFNPPHIWEAKGKVIVKDKGKVGCWELTTIKRIKVPSWYVKKSIRKKVLVCFASLCAGAVKHLRKDCINCDDKNRCYECPTSDVISAGEYANKSKAIIRKPYLPDYYSRLLVKHCASAAIASITAAKKADSTIDLVRLANRAVRRYSKK